ncbi:MAG: HAMP domain-containing sensor histidine kinase [Thermomicrobiales bacterium]
MFRHVGRRLAILNTIIVIVLIAAIGILTYGVLRRSLQQEVDQGLEERLATALSGSLSQESSGPAVRVTSDDGEGDDDHEEDDEHEDDDHDEDREIVSSGDTILIRVDDDGQIVENPRGIDLPGVPIDPGVAEALAGETDVRSVTLSDGDRMRVMTAPIFEDGEVVGAIQALRSLGEHEDQLELVRNMTVLGVVLGFIVAGPAGYFLSRRAMIPINAAFGRQRAFVADASHELRTPLTLIRANAEYARRKPDQTVSDVMPSLDNIVREVDGMSKLVSDLLMLARLDAGKLELDRSRRDLGEIAESVVESMRPLADSKEVELLLDIQPNVTAEVDRPRIEQVIRILLDNAIRHTSAGGEVEVGISARGSAREIEVRDTGAGIDPDELPLVFERFSRLDSGRAREHGGTGLGLAIARGLVEQHGGDISIDSRLGEGTVVTVRIPERSS